MKYSAGQYTDQDTGRTRWAVFQHQSRTWIFPTRYGQRAAERLARRLNANA